MTFLGRLDGLASRPRRCCSWEAAAAAPPSGWPKGSARGCAPAWLVRSALLVLLLVLVQAPLLLLHVVPACHQRGLLLLLLLNHRCCWWLGDGEAGRL